MALDVQTVGILFPGQGAQSIGMGRWLCETYPAARRLFDEAAEVLGYDLADICWNGPEQTLNATEFCQPALFVVGMAAATVLGQEKPNVIEAVRAAAGLSLGEYTAVCFAGGLEFPDAVRLVQRRGQAMQAAADAVESGMASVLGLDLEVVEQLCSRTFSGWRGSPAGESVVPKKHCHIRAPHGDRSTGTGCGRGRRDESDQAVRCRRVSHAADGTGCSITPRGTA